MDAATCPGCGGEMKERPAGDVSVSQCASCQGLFLDRSGLGRLIEAENDWYARRSTDTARLPRISADMPAPPPPSKARSYLDTLFGG